MPKDSIIYVDLNAPGPTHDGLTWCTAFPDLFSGLSAALAGDVVRVADGVYKPNEKSPDGMTRATYVVLAGVSLEGGYAGCGAVDPNERDWKRFETRLSGDLLGNDGPGFTNREDNIPTILGSWATTAPVNISGIVVSGSENSRGFGARFNDALTTVSDCAFLHNRRFNDGDGGAVWIHASPVVFERCKFHGNYGLKRGGAVYASASTISISDSSFVGNSSGTEDDPIPNFGGAIYSETCTFTIRNCLFRENETKDYGGAIAMSGNDLTVSHTVFQQNRALRSSAVDIEGTSITAVNAAFFNCLFDRNETYSVATSLGAALVISVGFNQKSVRNCTFVGNRTATAGTAGLRVSGSTLLRNNIFWENENSNGFSLTADTTSLGTYSLFGFPVMSLTNLFDDPSFVPGPLGCYYLSQTAAGQDVESPCVDAGETDASNYDLEGRTTRADEVADVAIVDMGFHYAISGATLLYGDYDRNGVIDLADIAGFQNCFTGSGPAAVSPCCRIFDFLNDADVDLDDLVSLSVSQ